MAETKRDGIIKAHNKLLEGQFFMDIRELRIIANTAAKIHFMDEDFKTYYIPLDKISTSNDLFDSKRREGVLEYRIDLITTELLKRVVKIEEEGGFTKYGLLCKCKRHKDSRYLEVQFHKDLKPFYIQLKSNFTQLDLDILNKFPSAYSFRLYELLKVKYNQIKNQSKNDIVEINYELQKLRDRMCINEDRCRSYLKFKYFKKYVLQSAQNHFKKYADIVFDYYPCKESGKSYTHIIFVVYPNNSSNIEKSINEQQNLENQDKIYVDQFSIQDLKSSSTNLLDFNSPSSPTTPTIKKKENSQENEEIENLLNEFNPEIKLLVADVLKKIALTRKLGKISPNIKKVFLEKLLKYETWKIEAGATLYIDKAYWEEKKGENYLLGIIRNMTEKEYFRIIHKAINQEGRQNSAASIEPRTYAQAKEAERRAMFEWALEEESAKQGEQNGQLEDSSEEIDSINSCLPSNA